MSKGPTSDEQRARRRTSWLAVAVFLLTFPVAGLTCPLGHRYGMLPIPVVAWVGWLVLGALAVARIVADPRRRRGVGWVAAAVALAPLIFWLIGVQHGSSPGSRASDCRINMLELGLALQTFANWHNDELPPSERWCDRLMKTRIIDSEWVFRCPEARNRRRSYALNRALEGDLRDHPGDTVLLFESDAGWNAAGGRELLVPEPRHLDGYNFVFCDGRIRWVGAEDVDSLRWEP